MTMVSPISISGVSPWPWCPHVPMDHHLLMATVSLLDTWVPWGKGGHLGALGDRVRHLGHLGVMGGHQDPLESWGDTWTPGSS